MYKRILCPIDGSETSNAGLGEAIRLARQSGGTIHLLYVVDTAYLQSTGYMIGEIYEQLRAGGMQLLETAKVEVAAANIPVDTVLVDSNMRRVADAILDESLTWLADIIVMGTHGHRGISHFILGSDAEAVIRMSETPVLLVKAKSNQLQ